MTRHMKPRMSPEDGATIPRGRIYVNIKALRWAISCSDCKGHTRAVLLQLAQQADEFGASFSSCKTLAAEIGVSDRTVRRCLGDLAVRKLIRRVGRVGRHGGQISNAIILIGWPGRKMIPSCGHPRLGPTIQEDKFARLNQWAISRKLCQGGTDNGSDQNKEKRIKNTTTSEYEVSSDSLLEPCFAALRAWATKQNRSYLAADIATLEHFIAQGADLDQHIIPAIREVSERPKVPVLRSWRYFEELIAARKKQKDRAPGSDLGNQEALKQETPTRAHEERTLRAEIPAVDSDDDMRAFLHKIVKRSPGGWT